LDENDVWKSLKDVTQSTKDDRIGIWANISLNNKIDLPNMDIRIRPNIKTMNWINTSNQHVLSQIQDLFDEESYKHFLCQLNEEQRTRFNDIVYCKRLHLDELVCLLLIGGVQIGKTFSFKPIIQGLLKLYNQELGFDLQRIKKHYLYGFYWEINF